jgi:hypothetical protein
MEGKALMVMGVEEMREWSRASCHGINGLEF